MLGTSALVTHPLVTSPFALETDDTIRTGLPLLDVTTLLWNQPVPKQLKPREVAKVIKEHKTLLAKKQEIENQIQSLTFEKVKTKLREIHKKEQELEALHHQHYSLQFKLLLLEFEIHAAEEQEEEELLLLM